MNNIQIAAVGDIAFEGANSNSSNTDAFSEVKDLLNKSDICIGNLENPLVDDGDPIKGKCTLHGTTGWASVLKESGFNILSLANNHMMDFGEAGLVSTINCLKRADISFVGAGMNEAQALAPLILAVKNNRIGIIARSSVIVASHCYATINKPGVAFFDLSETAGTVKKLKNEVDYLILILHWGLEHYAYPTIEQRNLARNLISVGADCIIGHHPHVLQGYEIINNKIVFYSLGNFLFDEFDWKYISDEGTVRELRATMSEQNKTGILTYINLKDANPSIKSLYPTFIKNSSVLIRSDFDEELTKIKKLNRMFSVPFYGLFWKLYSLQKEFELRIGKQVSVAKILKKIHKIRLAHLKQFLTLIKRSAKIISGKSTNPYD